MIRQKSLFGFLLALFCAVHFYGQSSVQIVHQTKDYGKHFRWVYDITQDDYGFMWFANHTGIRRYDGYNFVHYSANRNNQNSLSTNTIKRIAHDHLDGIWAYGIDQVLNRLDLKTDKMIQVNSRFKNGKELFDFSAQLVDFKLVGSQNFLLLFKSHTNDNQVTYTVWKYDATQNGLVHLTDLPSRVKSVNFFTEANGNCIWVWDKFEGYFLIDPEKREFRHFPIPNLNFQNKEFNAPVDDFNNIWIPSRDTINDFDQISLIKKKLPEAIKADEINRISVDNKGNFWFYHKLDELYRYDIKAMDLQLLKHSMFVVERGEQLMHHYFEDRNGTFWNGHFFGAVAFIKKDYLFKTFFDQPIIESVYNPNLFNARDILELTPKTFLVKENSNYLYLIHTDSNTTNKIDFDQLNTKVDFSKKIHSLAKGDHGIVWANQKNTLIKIDLENDQVEILNGPKKLYGADKGGYGLDEDWSRLFYTKNGRLLWCDLEGIYEFDERSKKFIKVRVKGLFSQVMGDFRHASYDPKRNVVFATYPEGVYRFDCKSNTATLIKMYEKEQGFDLLITDIKYWNNCFWLSTNKGLLKYDTNSKIRKFYRVNEGLPTNLLYGLESSKTGLWIATKKGLSQFDPVTEKTITFTEKQGLPDDEFNIWSNIEASDGHLYFGGLNGIVQVNPSLLKQPSRTKDTIHLVELSKYHEKKKMLTIDPHTPYQPASKLIIPPNERTLTFEFMSTLYGMEDVQYSHMLQGYDKNWISDGTSNKINYSQVPPGSYTMMVKVDGLNSTKPVIMEGIPIVVQQYWYYRWWAVLLYAIIFLSLVFWVSRYQLERKLEQEEAIKLKELDEIKTKMYTNITHEFRTPITVMLGMNSVIPDYTSEGALEKVENAVEMVNRNGHNLLNLVNQMLELSKLESGNQSINNQQGDINEYLVYRLESFQSFAAEKLIKIEFSSSQELIKMDFDVDKISYILGNLMSNAIKFTPKNGTIKVSTALKTLKSGERKFELMVEDSGVGMKPKELEHIFERFYQADNSHTRNKEGTGIGLSLVKEILNLLEGTIEVQSTWEKGSVFTILLPVTNDAENTNLSDEVVSNEWVGNLNKSSMNLNAYKDQDPTIPLVLIVEDNDDVSHYISVCIMDSYRVVVANNGSEGVQKSIELIPDIIISDVMMPQMDGFEFCSTVKSDERTSHIPVILLTGKSDIDSKIEGLQYGADVYLTKPFNRMELLIRLDNLLKLRSEIQKLYTNSNSGEDKNQLPPAENAFLIKLDEVILSRLHDENFNVAELCQLMHLSRTQLHRKLIAVTGESTTQLIRKIQMNKSKELLSSGVYNVSEVAFQTGFKTQAHFSRVFSETFGITPSDFRKKV